MTTVEVEGKQFQLKRYLTKGELVEIWMREAARRQYRKEDDPESIQRYSDELKIETQDIITKCSHENFNLLPDNTAFRLSEEIVKASETARGILYK